MNRKGTGPSFEGAARLIRVAVPVPLAEPFDYLWPVGERPPPGCRVRVPFGRGQRIGVVLEHPSRSLVEEGKLKPALEALDREPVLGEELLGTLRWAADYYHHPVGEVLRHALPALLRGARAAEPPPPPRAWWLTPLGREQLTKPFPAQARRQAAVLAALARRSPTAEEVLKALGARADALKRLAGKGWIEACADEPDPRRAEAAAAAPEQPPRLTAAQRDAVEAVERHGGGFEPFLLHGVTGSGKTEVYLRLIARQLDAGRQSLLLVPEIGLTPQLVGRLRARFGKRLAVMHSGLTERERLDAWMAARDGRSELVLGTRSAIFAPLPRAGLIIVDEEHDPSYKQQQGLRYSARDLAVLRARRLGVPVLLASATPSLESVHNATTGRYQLLSLPERIGSAGRPRFRVIDMNRHAGRQELSTPLIAAIETHLERGNQILLFLNRRGFAPVLFCPTCRRAEECRRCDAWLTVHAAAGRLRCHHCGAEKPLAWACADCGAERAAVGAGTQRVTDTLKSLFPDAQIARLDRDATSRRGALAAVLEQVASGATRILVGTQMLTKGHDFPHVTLVGVLNADQGLLGTDFRSDERLAQTLLQVAGRAGRAALPGEVLIQTHYPDHPLLACLLEQDYAAFARLALAEREAAGWPPFSHLAVWRAEHEEREAAFAFLRRVRAAAGRPARVRILGPAPDRMERRQGRYRAQLLLQSGERPSLHALLERTLHAVRDDPASRRVRWSLDVDPIEL